MIQGMEARKTSAPTGNTHTSTMRCKIALCTMTTTTSTSVSLQPPRAPQSKHLSDVLTDFGDFLAIQVDVGEPREMLKFWFALIEMIDIYLPEISPQIWFSTLF